MSSQHPIVSAPGRSYSAAYSLQYAKRDLLGALNAYGQIITEYPQAAEADFAREQLFNIVKLVVPATVLLDAQVKLARPYLESRGLPVA